MTKDEAIKVLKMVEAHGLEWEVLPFSEVIAWAELPKVYERK